MEGLSVVRPIGHGFELEVPDHIRSRFVDETYEPYSTALFTRACRVTDVVIDVGAHVGFFSLVAANAVPGGRVIAVEASPELADVVRRNLRRYRGIEVIRGTVGPGPGTVEVPVVGAADLGIPEGSRLVVKIAVDGHEIEALDALAPILDAATDLRLFVEFDPDRTERADHDPAELVRRLLARRLRLFALDERAWTWREVRRVDDALAAMGPRTAVNLYGVPAASAVTVSAVLHSGDLAGAERCHVEMVEDLVDAGCMVHSVIQAPDRGLAAGSARAGSAVTVIPRAPWWSPPPAAAADPATAAAWQAELVHPPLIAALREMDPDVVLTHTVAVPHGAVAAAVLGKRHVWWIHEYGLPEHGLVLPAPPARFGETLRALSDLVLVSAEGVERHFFPEPADRVRFVPYRPRVDARAPAGRPERPFTLGVVGSLQVGKRHADAIEAVALLAADGRDVHLECPGTRTPDDVERLVSLTRRFGVADRVAFPGFDPDRSAVYARFDAVALPSQFEGSSRIPFEATEAGLPVAYANSGGPTEYMIDGVTGLRFEPGDARGLAAAVARLMDEPGLSERLVAGARDRFDRRHRDEGARLGVRDALLEAVRSEHRPPATDVVGWMAAGWLHRFETLTSEAAATARERDAALARARGVEQSRIWRSTAWYRRLRELLRARRR